MVDVVRRRGAFSWQEAEVDPVSLYYATPFSPLTLSPLTHLGFEATRRLNGCYLSKLLVGYLNS